MLVFLLILPTSGFSAEKDSSAGRYIVYSDSLFWRNTLGKRHDFKSYFSTGLSEFQVRLVKLFGLKIEPVGTLFVLEEDAVAEEEATAPNYPQARVPWGVSLLGNGLEAVPFGGDKIRVAILDTGVDTDHPDLESRVALCKDFSNPSVAFEDGACEDFNGHGTHVAGIIGANGGSQKVGIYGVAPQAELLVYKTCDSTGKCFADDIAAAIADALKERAQIINLSFGSDADLAILKNAIKATSSKDAIVVSGLGNDGPYPESIDYPAAYSQVLGASAFNIDQEVPDWSSRSSVADFFVLPGVDVQSTWIEGKYNIVSGTSVAAAHLSGLLARYWQIESDTPAKATLDFVKNLVTSSVSKEERDYFGRGFPHDPVSTEE